jgi:hypothetical protein
MLYGKCDDDFNPVDNQNMHNVEGDQRLSPGLQSLTTRNMLKIRFVCPVPQLCFLKQELIFYKTKHSSFKHLTVASV